MKTEDIILKLAQLNESSRQLDIPEQERIEMLDAVTSYANQFISGLDTIKAFQEKEATALEITNKKRSLPALLDLYQKEVAETGINAASGKHLGYIPGGGIWKIHFSF